MIQWSPRLKPVDACAYLLAQHGIDVKRRTLNNLRWAGGGPSFKKFGKHVYYELPELDAWANSRLSAPMRSTSDVAA